MSSILFVLGGGIGNIVQATPAIKSIAKAGHQIDLILHCNSSDDVKEIFQIPAVNRIFLNEFPTSRYDYQLMGPFTPGKKYNSGKVFKTRINYAQHIAEANVYYDLAQQIGINELMEACEINIGTNGPKIDPDTVIFYTGGKSNWTMKRWDKYDKLASFFKKVLVIGSPEDINSHGNPAWIKNSWQWPEHVQFLSTSLQKAAYAISQCHFFVGNDGGLAHIAAATGVPTYVLFGPSSVIKNKPYAPNAHAIAIDLDCRPCQFRKGEQYFGSNKAGCPLNMKCMTHMTLEYVLDRLPKV